MTVLFVSVAGSAAVFAALQAHVRAARVRRRTQVWLAEIERAMVDDALHELIARPSTSGAPTRPYWFHE